MFILSQAITSETSTGSLLKKEIIDNIIVLKKSRIKLINVIELTNLL